MMEETVAAGQEYAVDSTVEGIEDTILEDEKEKGVTFLGKRVKGISGSTIKLIAIITMFIDHLGATVVEAIFNKQLHYEMAHNITNQYGYFPVYDSAIYNIDRIMRGIGRIAFPLFCFLLLEGFMHTRSRMKYMFRLVVFAIISEVPFDLAFNHKVVDNSYQNVFFTLFIGFATITILDLIIYKFRWYKVFKMISCILVSMIGVGLAMLLRTDYDMIGVITILIMYLLRRNKTASIYGGCMALTLAMLQEAYAFLGVIPVALYNGTRGLKMKYFFYIFYPAHLLILYGICKIVGLY